MLRTAFAAAAVLAAATFASSVHADEPDATTTGTVAGAATGALVGGPVGAVVGGAMGMTTGAIIDDASKPKDETIIIKKRQPNAVVIDEQPAVVIDE
jgi:outer membrane lipoprotein SlyB